MKTLYFVNHQWSNMRGGSICEPVDPDHNFGMFFIKTTIWALFFGSAKVNHKIEPTCGLGSIFWTSSLGPAESSEPKSCIESLGFHRWERF